MKKHFQLTKPTGLLSVIAVDLIYLSLSETINSRFDGIEEGLSAAEKKKAHITAGPQRHKTRIIQKLKDFRLNFYRFARVATRS